MSKQDVPLEERIKGIDSADELIDLAIKEFLEELARLGIEATTNLKIRTALLADPLAELKKRGIPFPPGTKLRFLEREKNEYVGVLEPFRGENLRNEPETEEQREKRERNKASEQELDRLRAKYLREKDQKNNIEAEIEKPA